MHFCHLGLAGLALGVGIRRNWRSCHRREAARSVLARIARSRRSPVRRIEDRTRRAVRVRCNVHSFVDAPERCSCLALGGPEADLGKDRAVDRQDPNTGLPE